MQKGLLLGAGASVDFGLPLVSEITSRLRSELSPGRIRLLNNQSKAAGDGYPEAIVEELIEVLSREEMHYEAILGHFQVQQYRARSNRELSHSYGALYQWITRAVSDILIGYSEQNIRKILGMPPEYRDGISFLVAKNRPLWIFSLNYDLVIESIAAELRLSIFTGFKNDSDLPCRNERGDIIGRLATSVITESEMNKTGLFFPWNDEERIHLLKIHGSLDMFTFRDGKDLLKLLPTGSGGAGPLGSLIILRTQVALSKRVNTSAAAQLPAGEYVYKDDNNKFSFLRHSIVAGAFKFEERHPQTLPRQPFKAFECNIKFLTSLVTIGYSFGDNHINEIIRDWLQSDSSHSLEIVDPSTDQVPRFILHVSRQVTNRRFGASQYFGSVARLSV
jgi:hypothetical protein